MIERINKYIVGNVYYEVGYNDRQFCYPEIREFVFIGEDISADDLETDEILYFQHLENFMKYGSATDGANENDNFPLCTVVEIRSDETSKMLTPEELGTELLAIQDRNIARLK